MRDVTQRPGRGVELLLEQIQALESDPRVARRNPPFERLSGKLGPDLAGMLVHALAGAHASQRRDLVA